MDGIIRAPDRPLAHQILVSNKSQYGSSQAHKRHPQQKNCQIRIHFHNKAPAMFQGALYHCVDSRASDTASCRYLLNQHQYSLDNVHEAPQSQNAWPQLVGVQSPYHAYLKAKCQLLDTSLPNIL